LDNKNNKGRYLKQLIDIANVLTSSELITAKKHLGAFESNYTSANKKMLRLFKEIVNNKRTDYDYLKKRISKDSNDNSFNKLIRRTMDRLQESIILDVNIRRKDAYSEVFRKKYFLRKQLIQVQILIDRGLTERPLIIVNNVIRYAKKFELYDESIEAYIYKQQILRITGRSEFYEMIDNKINHYEKCKVKLKYTKDVFRLFLARNTKKAKYTFGKSFSNKLKLIFKYYQETNSDNILSYYLLLKIEEYSVRKDTIGELSYIHQLIKLLNKSPVLYSSARIAYLKINVTIIELSSFRFDIALNEINDAIDIMGESRNLNYVIANSLKVSALFYNYKYEKVRIEIESIEKNYILSKYAYHAAKIQYQKAMNYFALGMFEEVKTILYNLNDIEKDKEGWHLWMRIMRIICSIELLKLNLIDYDVESFRKFIERLSKNVDIKKREQLIMKIIVELDRCDYDFDLVATKRAKELNLLRSNNPKVRWDPSSPEMILFHDWFDAKREKRVYYPKFEPYLASIEKKEILA